MACTCHVHRDDFRLLCLHAPARLIQAEPCYSVAEHSGRIVQSMPKCSAQEECDASHALHLPCPQRMHLSALHRSPGSSQACRGQLSYEETSRCPCDDCHAVSQLQEHATDLKATGDISNPASRKIACSEASKACQATQCCSAPLLWPIAAF